MLTPFKYLVGGFVVLVLVLTIAYVATNQNIGTRTTAEMDSEAITQMIDLGTARTEGKAEIRKKEILTFIITEVARVQKQHDYDIDIDVVYFDEEGSVTTNDEDIQSFQYRVRYVDEDGEVKSTSERRMALNVLERGDR